VSNYSLMAMLPEGMDRHEVALESTDHAAIGVRVFIVTRSDIDKPLTVERQLITADAFVLFRGSQAV